jgi:hypothetical protein
MVASVLAAQLPVATGVAVDVVGAGGRLVLAVGCVGRRVVTVVLLVAVAVEGVSDAVVGGPVAPCDALGGAGDDDGTATTVLVAVTVAVLVAEHEARSSSEMPIAVRRMTQRSPLSQGCADSIPGCGT